MRTCVPCRLEVLVQDLHELQPGLLVALEREVVEVEHHLGLLQRHRHIDANLLRGGRLRETGQGKDGRDDPATHDGFPSKTKSPRR